MADEVELKLELPAADADHLFSSELFAGKAKTAKQVSIYFDTPDNAVADAGFSLRIRRAGNTRIQTIKADGASSAGLFARTEWERPVENDVPVLDYATPLPTVLGKAAEKIAPRFEVHIERRKWVIDEAGTSIEVVLDRGEVQCGDRTDPVCEIELELKLGDPAALFLLARKIDAVVAVRLGVLTKSERGYRLAAAEQASVKAGPVALGADISAADAFKRIIQSCIRQYRLNEALLLSSRNPNALHQARVAVRRMRSAFSIFKPMIGDDGTGLRDELKWLASALGEARDLDVLMERAPPGALHVRIAEARDTTYDSLFTTLADPRARTIMFDIAHWVAQGQWADSDDVGGQPARAFAASVLARFRRRIKRRGKGLAAANDEMRHEVRKDAKKLRYASEFFASLFTRKREQRRHQRFVSALEELQDRLGALNDLAAAPGLIGKLGLGDYDGASLLLPSDSSRKKMLQRAEEAHEELVDTKRFW